MTVLMGGIIAYNGDVIGRKYGKRRATIFGLRPRHTAVLVTSATGVLISALTTGALFLLVPPVREVILRGERAIQVNREYAVANSELRRDKQGLESHNRALALRERRMVASLDEQSKRLATLTAAETRLAREVEKAVREKAEAVARQHGAEDNAREAERQTRASHRENARLNLSNLKLTRLNQRLDIDWKEQARQNRALLAQNRSLAAQIGQKQKQNDEYDQQNREVAQQNMAYHRENLRLSQESDRLSTAIAKLQESYSELTGRNASLELANQRLEAQSQISLAALYKMFEDMRLKRVVIRGGEDLARAVVPPNSPPEAVRQTIDMLMHAANEAARAKGAASSDPASLRAVHVVDKKFVTQTQLGTGTLEATETDSINAMVSRLAWSASPVCVLALAIANSVENEPAAIDFRPYEDHLVYPKGRAVAKRGLNAAEPAEKVFGDLVEFLKDVGRTAIERGMIPRIDPATGEPQVGSLSWPELVSLVERARGFNGPVQITAVAADDANASGPLPLTFKIEPGP
jgi:uncharacterized protein (DUF3084 family)